MFDLPRLTYEPLDPGARSEQDSSSASVELEPVPGFRLTSEGLFIEEADQNIYVCDPIAVLAFARTPESSSWSKRIVMLDRDGMTHERIISAAQLMRFGFDVCATLIDEGLRVAPHPQALRWLLTYLTRAEPKTRALIAERPGWIQTPKSVFYVQAHRVVGRGTETVVLAPEIRIASKRSESGSVEQWRNTIGAWSIGNSRLTMGVSMAFASMTLAFANVENGGINLAGPSSCGKTTVLGSAASVMGGPGYVGNWRQTDNAFEAAAVQHNDALMCVDELGQADARKIDQIPYLFGNAQGKGRAARDGGARARKSWRALLLSTSETTLAQHALSAGTTLRAGQEVRLIDLDAEVPGGFGAFENLHGHADGAAFSDVLRAACREFHGTVGMEFARRCAMDGDHLPERLRTSMDAFMSACKSGADGALEGQATRVAHRFALIAAAGELASEWGLTGWAPGAAHAAAQRCFTDWLQGRGTDKNTEGRTILQTLCHFLVKCGESRFSEVDRADDDQQRTVFNRAGWTYRNVEDGVREYWIESTVFRREIYAGFNISTVCRALETAGCITTMTEAGTKRYDIKRTVGRDMRPRVYVVSQRVFEAGEATQASPA